jgi:hypothetical protein
MYGVLIVAIVVLVGILNDWMYSHGIAITGLEHSQQELPFHLAGILYYATKFLVPMLLFVVYMRTSRSAVLATIILLFAIWAGVSQLSRTTYVLTSSPVLLFAFLDRRHARLVAASVFFLISFSWVQSARGVVYYVSDGIAYGDVSVSLPKVVWEAAVGTGIESVSGGLYTLLSRPGGAQDVVLASQYDTAGMGGSVSEFQRLFLLRSKRSADEIQYALYGFVPPSGFSAGSGGFSARMLLISGGNWFVLAGLSVWVAILLTVGELLAQRYIAATGSLEIGYLVGGAYSVLLYACGLVHWLYGFILFAAIGLLVLRGTALSTARYQRGVNPSIGTGSLAYTRRMNHSEVS